MMTKYILRKSPLNFWLLKSCQPDSQSVTIVFFSFADACRHLNGSGTSDGDLVTYHPRTI